MATYEWCDNLSVGDDEIDGQHQHLFDLLASLEARMEDRVATRETLDGLVEYVGVHFSTEEQKMRAAGYEGLEAHHAVHRDFVRDVMGWQRRWRHDQLTGRELFEHLGAWLVAHVGGLDQDYAEALKRAAERTSP